MRTWDILTNKPNFRRVTSVELRLHQQKVSDLILFERVMLPPELVRDAFQKNP